jgi:hypothetical protein
LNALISIEKGPILRAINARLQFQVVDFVVWAAHTFEKRKVEIFRMIAFYTFITIEECTSFFALAISYLIIVNSASSAIDAILHGVVPVAGHRARHTSRTIKLGLVIWALSACFQRNIVDLILGATQA